VHIGITVCVVKPAYASYLLKGVPPPIGRGLLHLACSAVLSPLDKLTRVGEREKGLLHWYALPTLLLRALDCIVIVSLKGNLTFHLHVHSLLRPRAHPRLLLP
jgi:hypothetical protein